MNKSEIHNESVKSGLVNKKNNSQTNYQPELLVNDTSNGKKFLTNLISELESCNEFWISVAFVTTSGIATLMNTLIELEKKNIRGKILTSQYLNFTQPEALKRLRKFKNIELKIAINDSFHSKGYLFKHGKINNIIIGSSNLTQNALCLNKEWNLKISARENELIYDQVINEFTKEYESAILVTDAFIDRYSIIWNTATAIAERVNLSSVFQKTKVEPNQMQKDALNNLKNLRANGCRKALLISATGTGKTYLSAFDVQKFKPGKFLFVVHRRIIAEKAMETFRNLIDNQISMGVFSGDTKEKDADYLFSTIQTVSKEENLKLFCKNHFDYIVIDESHRAGADSYKKILNYFSPKFLLGMTATPERTDGADIFKLFDYNIAYEIRLNRALSEDMLSPFHYYGVSDITINDELIDDFSDFNKLTCDERVKHIIEKSRLYGTDSGVITGLVFCPSNEISKQLSKKFNEVGFKSIYLSGESKEEIRTDAIKKLESNGKDKIDYIFTVDIFNEGIDIPSVNQIIMLRPTQSAIIFVQQLGRGLRKSKNKDYLTVIDFIGNYNNNYLVPIALYGDTSFNKDTIRKMLASGSNLIPGISTVNFDAISKDRIFDSINKANMQKLTDLKKDYHNLKYKIGKIPMMMDFINFGSRDPWLYSTYKKSYLNFVDLIEDRYKGSMSMELSKLLEYFTLEINNGKRVEESYLLSLLIRHEDISKNSFIDKIYSTYGYKIDEELIESLFINLNFEFIRKSFDCVKSDNNRIFIGDGLKNALDNDTFKKFLIDSIDYSIATFDSNFKLKLYNKGLVRYQKYSRKDVCRLLNWPKDISSTIYGYRTKNSITPCFVTYHKEDELDGDINYNDHFINSSLFAWESRSNRKKSSEEIQNVINSKRILLFVKKEDGEGTDFYYLGDVSIVEGSVEQGTMKNTNSPVVFFKYLLDKPVNDSLYNYIINI
ncbi:DUF3427 domain-containing protein [Chondrinema litorale]|uniref:DUF3427 domain-containing protein n=1 Tax=Chondrinema litorale TaxID=2994555 RepID=UPI002543EFC3|nr:DEAD/DEAH box helicase [Chondrinema litorale]UZR99847.1 DEAD/DEAH box helicase [Chondrinema litorale]